LAHPGESGESRNRARLHTELAGLYYSRGNMNVALEELRIATAADPNYALAYGMFGMIYMDLKENALAEQNFDRALRLAPNEPDLNHNYGWYLCQTKREPESIKYFLQAIRNPLYPTPWRSYSAAGVCSLRVKNVKDADEFFQRALKIEPDEPNAQAMLRFGNNTLYLRNSRRPDKSAYVDHFAFEIENYDQDRVEAELKRRGYKPEADSRLGWTIHDPEGMRIEVAGKGLPEYISTHCKGRAVDCPGGRRG